MLTQITRLSSTYRPVLMAALCCAIGLAAAPAAYGQASTCGSLQNHYGPYDYRIEKENLRVVERFHFSSAVEAGLRGVSTTEPGGDLTYILGAFPNHHRALLAMVRYAERMKSAKPPGLQYSVECYFERAIRFRNDDIVARMLYTQYLIKNGREKEAATQVEFGETIAADSAFAHYYLGMLYFDLKNYDRALAKAHKSAELGQDISELRGMLQKVGRWKDPDPTASASAEPAAPAAPDKP